MPTELPDSAKVLRNDVGKRMATALEAIAQGGGGGASVVQKTMAEYTALPTSEKMNGSIYKITDKALIYCLDEEYHALKEITSAAYAQLTPAEQNNGTIYVKTDEETTAYDIMYSAGVSVADKLDSLSTVESVNVSYPNGVSYHHGFIAKIGKLVICNLWVKVETTVANNGTLINDMPLSAYEFRAPKFVGGSQYVNDSVSGAVYMDTVNGRLNIMTAITGTTSNPVYVSMNFSYFTA